MLLCLLLLVSLLAVPLVGVGAVRGDSTSIIKPSLTSPPPLLWVKNATLAQQCVTSTIGTGTASSPFQLQDTGGAAIVPSSFDVPNSGIYSVTVTLKWIVHKLTTAASPPFNLWTDMWATDASPISSDIRLFYSGDMPIQSKSLDKEETIIMTGQTHLLAGATVFYPEVWSTIDPSIQWCIIPTINIVLLKADAYNSYP